MRARGPSRRGPTLWALTRAALPALGISGDHRGLDDPAGRLLTPAALDLARAHGILGLLPAGGPTLGDAAGDAAGDVEQFRSATRARLVRAMADARTVTSVGAALGAPIAVVKGPVLALDLYPRPDTRPFGDVDVLTLPEAFGDVLAALESAGGVCLTRNWDDMSAARFAEVAVLMPAGTVIDLHWHLVNVAALRRRYRLDTTEVLGAAVTAPVPGALTLDPVASLGHVGWHLTASGGTRVLWALDVELAARRVVARAEEVLAWATRTGMTLPVAVALDFAAAVVPGGAAATVGAAFPRSPWRAANAAVKHAVLHRPAGERSGAVLPMATRTSTWDSVAAMRPPLRTLLGRPAADPQDLDTLPLDRGGAAGRSRYLTSVVTDSW